MLRLSSALFVAAGPLTCANEEAARILNLKAGSVIDWNIWNRNIRTRVACIERTESVRMSARFEFFSTRANWMACPPCITAARACGPPMWPRCNARSTSASRR
jgi:hypothetical protein